MLQEVVVNLLFLPTYNQCHTALIRVNIIRATLYAQRHGICMYFQKIIEMKRILLTIICGGILFACGETITPYEIDKPELSLNYDKTYQFNVTQSNVRKSSEGFEWTSSDESVGTVSSSGYFKAKKIGTTTITGKSGKSKVSSKVTVKPYSEMYKEPYFGFGSTPSVIKSKDTRKVIFENGDGLTLESGSSKASAILYLLENGKMFSTGAQIVITSSNITELATFIKERYTREDYPNSEFIWFTDGKNMRVAIIAKDTFGIIVYYMTKEKRDSYYSSVENKKQFNLLLDNQKATTEKPLIKLSTEDIYRALE